MHNPTSSASPTPLHPRPSLSVSDQGSDGEYGEPIWDQATLDAIDDIQAEYLNKLKQKKASHRPTHLQIQVEGHSDNLLQMPRPSFDLYYNFLLRRFSSLNPNFKNTSSLYSLFRIHRHFLSVSDLVSCLWCQYQVEYGLFGKRYLKPSQRPKSFISSSGVEIKVNPKLVISRQTILDGGKRVHAKLEKEVAPEPVRAEVVTQVDIWGLKVMNTITNLSLLRSTGMMREIHVWGFIGGFLIQGITDQIDLIPVPLTTNDDKTAHSSTNDSSPKNGQSLETSSTPSKRLLARISDSKTTQSSTLPPSEYTDSARYQLMLYKYLHDQNASGRFDLDRFGDHLGINLEESFSPSFLRDIEPLLKTIGAGLKAEKEEQFTCPNTLRGMFKLYDRIIKMVGVSDETLGIVYRKRGGRQTKSAGGTDPKKPKLNLDQPAIQTNMSTTLNPTHPLPHLDFTAKQISPSSNVDSINLSLQLNESKEPRPDSDRNESLIQDSAKLINESNTPLSLDHASLKNGTKKGVKKEVENVVVKKEKTSFSSAIDEKDMNKIENYFSKFSSIEKMRPKVDKPDDKKIIGSYEFEFHPIEFSKFIIDAIRFWNGDQDAVGVDLADFNKCEPCEFKDSCEWRSKISNQFLDSIEKPSSFS